VVESRPNKTVSFQNFLLANIIKQFTENANIDFILTYEYEEKEENNNKMHFVCINFLLFSQSTDIMTTVKYDEQQ
jgi:hypothetical protein